MTVAYPWFLLGLVALVVPVLIHVMRHKAAGTIDLATARLVTASLISTKKKFQWRDLLLLIIRCVFLVFAFTYPEWTNRQKQENQSIVLILVIDASATMTASGGFDQAIAQAKKEVESAPLGTGFSVILAGARADVRTIKVAYDKESVLNLLGNISAYNGGCNVFEALGESLRQISLTEKPGKIIFYTDQQANAWDKVEERQWAMYRRAVSKMKVPPELEVKHLGRLLTGANIQVSDVSLSRECITTNRLFTVTAIVRNASSVAQPSCRAELLIEGQLMGSRKVPIIAAGESVELSWQVMATSTALQLLEVVVHADDEILVDNRAYSMVRSIPKIRVRFFGESELDILKLLVKSSSSIEQADERADVWVMSKEGVSSQEVKSFLKRGGAVILLGPGLYEYEEFHPVLMKQRIKSQLGFTMSGMKNVRVFEYTKAMPKSSVSHALTLANKDLWMAAHTVGNSRVMWLGSLLDGEEDTVSTTAEGFAFLSDMLHWLVSGGHDYLISDESSLVNAKIPFASDGVGEAKGPDGQLHGARIQKGRLALSSSSMPGVYSVSIEDQIFRFIIHRDKSESNLLPVVGNVLEHYGLSTNLIRGSQSFETPKLQFWQVCLIACILLWALETWWAGVVSKRFRKNAERKVAFGCESKVYALSRTFKVKGDERS